jgi:hypothetical protein
MAPRWTDYTRHFLENLYTEMPYGRWWKKVLTNLGTRARGKGCCGHRGEPGC